MPGLASRHALNNGAELGDDAQVVASVGGGEMGGVRHDQSVDELARRASRPMRARCSPRATSVGSPCWIRIASNSPSRDPKWYVSADTLRCPAAFTISRTVTW